MKQEVLRMNHVLCKDGENRILNYLSMQIFRGEIYGVLCLEQPGIEKMLELICWNRPVQNGQIFFEEKLVNSVERSSGSRNRAAMIGKKCCLIDELSLADNLFVIRENFRRFVIPEQVIWQETKRLLGDWGLELSPDTPVKRLTPYEKLIAEILRAVVLGDALIILWEISDLLSSEELHRFHLFMRRLADQGHTFLYIYGHHEVLRPVCDRVAVFKAGTIQKVFKDTGTMREEITKVFARFTYDKIHQLHLGVSDSVAEEVVLQLENVESEGIRGLSFFIRRGETVLLLDQSNTILDQLMEILRGAKQIEAGELRLNTREKDPRKSLAYVQRDATNSMLFPELSYLENLCFLLAGKVPFFCQKKRYQKSVYREYREELGAVLDAPNLYGLPPKELYTLVYYRCLIAKPELVICLQPMSDMDMYLRPHVLELIIKLRNNGIAVLVLGTELYDVFQIADRLIQVKNGRVVMESSSWDFDKTKLDRKEFLPDWEDF